MLRFLWALPQSLYRGFVVYLPGEAGILLRRRYYQKRFRSCGRNLTILPGAQIRGERWIEAGDDVMIRENVVLHTGPGPADDRRDLVSIGHYEGRERGLVRIGNRSRIAFGAVLLGYGGISIGEKCGIGPGAVILSESFHHKGSDPTRVYKYCDGADPEERCVLQGFVDLKDGAGVASQAIVLPGSTIGRDAWVAPHSVVRVGGVVPDNVIAKGDPAGVVFRRSYGRPGDPAAAPRPTES